MIKHFTVFVLLFFLWLCLSGLYTVLLVSLGVLSAISVVWLCRHLGTFHGNSEMLRLNIRLYRYLPWLLIEIIKSNLHVASVILHPLQNIHSKIIYRPTSQRTDSARTVHANSITLTPGTISIDIQPNFITVHALTEHTAQGIQDNAMDTRVSQLEEQK